MNNKKWVVFFVEFIFVEFIIGFFWFWLITATAISPQTILRNANATIVMNGTDEYYWLQSMEFNKKNLIEYWDLRNVIRGNLCGKEQSSWVTDITESGFRIQCCVNFTDCENYFVRNKKFSEVAVKP